MLRTALLVSATTLLLVTAAACASSTGPSDTPAAGTSAAPAETAAPTAPAGATAAPTAAATAAPTAAATAAPAAPPEIKLTQYALSEHGLPLVMQSFEKVEFDKTKDGGVVGRNDFAKVSVGKPSAKLPSLAKLKELHAKKDPTDKLIRDEADLLVYEDAKQEYYEIAATVKVGGASYFCLITGLGKQHVDKGIESCKSVKAK
jgi:hypothetical protein